PAPSEPSTMNRLLVLRLAGVLAVGLFASCGMVIGLDGLEKSDCAGPCGDASGDAAHPPESGDQTDGDGSTSVTPDASTDGTMGDEADAGLSADVVDDGSMRDVTTTDVAADGPGDGNAADVNDGGAVDAPYDGSVVDAPYDSGSVDAPYDSGSVD